MITQILLALRSGEWWWQAGYALCWAGIGAFIVHGTLLPQIVLLAGAAFCSIKLRNYSESHEATLDVRCPCCGEDFELHYERRVG